MSLTFFAEIELNGVTLYATNAEPGNRHRTVGGTSVYFEPRLRVHEFLQQFTSMAVSQELPSTVSIELDNSDGRYDVYHGVGRFAQIWDNRTLTIRSGDGGAF